MTTPEYTINVARIEDLQMIKDTGSLNKIFTLSKSTIVQGGVVLLTRESRNGPTEIFDRISTDDDLETYRQSVFKFL